MPSFKLVFSKENIRRVDLPGIPSWDQFSQFLEENYKKFMTSETLIQYVDNDGDRVTVGSQLEWSEFINSEIFQNVITIYFENEGGIAEQVQGFKGMADRHAREAIGFAQQSVGNLKREVPEILSTLIKDGKINPEAMQYLQTNLVDAQVDAQKAIEVMHTRALTLMSSVNTYDLEQGRDYLIATVKMVPGHMTALYNLACAESLLGNVKEAISALEQSVASGFRDLENMIRDADFQNIRDTEAFQMITAKLASIIDFERQSEETAQEPVIETVEEPVVDTVEETVTEEPVAAEPIMNVAYDTAVENLELLATRIVSFMSTFETPRQTTENENENEIEEPTPVSKPVDLTASIQPLKETYNEELETLSAMGFTTDEDVLLLLLEQYSGKIEEVTQFLLSFTQ